MIITAEEAIRFLGEGKVVAVPTETVYGLAADALNPEAIARVFEVKNRPADNPLICHFYSEQQIADYVLEIPEPTKKLLRQFSPGPISFLLDLAEDSPLKFATCGSNRVIVRIPDHTILLEIIQKLNRPLAAPSANTSGKVSPTSRLMVENDLGENIFVVDGGRSTVGLESTIVDARNEEEIFLLRPGSIGEDELRHILPNSKITQVTGEQGSIIPGSRYRHYAPDTVLFLIDNYEEILHENNVALVLTQEQGVTIYRHHLKIFSEGENEIVILGSMNDLNDLARNFYHHLASLDDLKVKRAYLLKNDWGSSSLGKAIESRLMKIVTSNKPK